MTTYIAYPIVPIFAFLAALLASIPFIFHFRSWNIGVLIFCVWIIVMNLNTFVNTIVWHGHARNVAPIWCDITSHLQATAQIAIFGCFLVINRYLYNIAHFKSLYRDDAERRKEVAIALFLTVIFPLITTALGIIDQPVRYVIFEGQGCILSSTSWVSIVITNIWPSVLGVISSIYCVRTVIAFWRHRQELKAYLDDQSIESSKYIRLICQSLLDTCLALPVNIYILVRTCKILSKARYEGWSVIHHDFYFIFSIPYAIWSQDKLLLMLFALRDWVYIFIAIVFFFFFGMTRDVRTATRVALGRINIRQKASTSPLSTIGFGTKPPTSKLDKKPTRKSLSTFRFSSGGGAVSEGSDCNFHSSSDLEKGNVVEISFATASGASKSFAEVDGDDQKHGGSISGGNADPDTKEMES